MMMSLFLFLQQHTEHQLQAEGHHIHAAASTQRLVAPQLETRACDGWFPNAAARPTHSNAAATDIALRPTVIPDLGRHFFIEGKL